VVTVAEEETVDGRGWLTRERIAEVVRFCAAGLAVFGLDEGSLILLRSQTHLPLGLDSALAYTLASLVNFVMSRQWVFEQASNGADPRTALIRYVVVIGVGLLITAAAVPALTACGLDYRIAKPIVSLLLGIANYFVFPGWVFRRGRADAASAEGRAGRQERPPNLQP
jgi:putative flippase GtrA